MRVCIRNFTTLFLGLALIAIANPSYAQDASAPGDDAAEVLILSQGSDLAEPSVSAPAQDVPEAIQISIDRGLFKTSDSHNDGLTALANYRASLANPTAAPRIVSGIRFPSAPIDVADRAQFNSLADGTAEKFLDRHDTVLLSLLKSLKATRLPPAKIEPILQSISLEMFRNSRVIADAYYVGPAVEVTAFVGFTFSTYLIEKLRQTPVGKFLRLGKGFYLSYGGGLAFLRYKDDDGKSRMKLEVFDDTKLLTKTHTYQVGPGAEIGIGVMTLGRERQRAVHTEGLYTPLITVRRGDNYVHLNIAFGTGLIPGLNVGSIYDAAGARRSLLFIDLEKLKPAGDFWQTLSKSFPVSQLLSSGRRCEGLFK